MSIETIAESIKERVATSGFDSSVKFDCGADGMLVIDGTEVSTADKDADCTIGVALDDLESLVAGDLDPMGAFMQGKFQIDGDMSVAMKLGQLL